MEEQIFVEGSTLTIAAGTTLYFHGDAGINVNGRLICNGTADKKRGVTW